jgi:hypothetical protein
MKKNLTLTQTFASIWTLHISTPTVDLFIYKTLSDNTYGRYYYDKISLFYFTKNDKRVYKV